MEALAVTNIAHNKEQGVIVDEVVIITITDDSLIPLGNQQGTPFLWQQWNRIELVIIWNFPGDICRSLDIKECIRPCLYILFVDINDLATLNLCPTVIKPRKSCYVPL